MNLLDSPKVQKDLRNYENAVKKIVNTLTTFQKYIESEKYKFQVLGTFLYD